MEGLNIIIIVEEDGLEIGRSESRAFSEAEEELGSLERYWEREQEAKERQRMQEMEEAEQEEAERLEKEKG